MPEKFISIFKKKLIWKCIILVLIFSKYSTVFSYTLNDYRKNPFGNILFIRHAIAPGFGDPEDFDLNDCSTQRNLNKEGREQAFKIGEKIKAIGIRFSKVYSSQWCRCLETARYMNLGKIISEPGLNSFFQGIVKKEKTLAKLQNLLKSLEAKKELFLMVTHQVTITAITGITVSSGGAIAYNPNLGQSKEIIIFD
tara:strand:+ start:92 stop:679 length:588 start_codon:yes stop_codon:yes gene_type:complete